jgi:hypothetical protein
MCTNNSFRITSENGKVINECNDDGESRAGEWVLEPLVVSYLVRSLK